MNNKNTIRLFRSVALLFATAFLIGSCSKSDVGTFRSQDRIWFTQRVSANGDWVYYNDLNRTFALYPGMTSLEVPFQVNLIGDPVDYDREFKVVTVDSLTTAVAAEYEISSSVLRANQIVDTLWVTLHKSARLDNEEVKLTLYMVENENFTTGYSDKLLVKVTFSNKTAKPDWWTEEMTQVYLGDYSEEKFVALFTFMTTECGIEDLNEITDMAPSALRKLLLRFRDYIADNNLTEANGSPIEIPIM